MCHLFTDSITTLADLATGVPDGPTPVFTPTPDAAEEAPPTPTTASAGPSPFGALGVPLSASAAARLPVFDDSDAVKDAAGQQPKPVCTHPLLLHVHAPSEAVSHRFAIWRWEQTVCCKSTRKRDAVLAEFCLSRGASAKCNTFQYKSYLPLDPVRQLMSGTICVQLVCLRSCGASVPSPIAC